MIGYHSVRVISLAILYEKRMTRQKQLKGKKFEKQPLILTDQPGCNASRENDRSLVNDVLQWKTPLQNITNGPMIFNGP